MGSPELADSGDLEQANETLLDAQRDQDAFRLMLLIRRFEEKAGQLYALGTISILPKLSIGREACVYGTLMARGPGDIVVTGRR